MVLKQLERQIEDEIKVLREKVKKKKNLLKKIRTSEIPVSVLKPGFSAESPDGHTGTDFCSININGYGETIVVEYE